ncbi:MAG: hypothetical protein LM557_04815 [Desulfurococcaceae archaeon]|jgi:hypothetical protein|nr:hypothetical protein [Desulfurococcaceae archaeon]
MSSDKDILELLRKMLSSDVEKKGREGLELEKIEPDSPHGIYVYDFNKEKWVLRQVTGDPNLPWGDGYYVVYFDNARCPACRNYDNYWFPFVKIFGRILSDVNYVIVLCDWFARECVSEAASGAFRKFNVHASPTTILFRVNSGEIKEKVEVSGVKKIDELLKLVTELTSKKWVSSRI